MQTSSIRRFVVSAVMVGAVSAVGIALTGEAAQALPRQCNMAAAQEDSTWATYYYGLGQVYFSVGDWATSSYYSGQSAAYSTMAAAAISGC